MIGPIMVGDPVWRDVIRKRAVGWTYSRIAEDVGISYNRVWWVLKSPEGKAHLAKLLDDMDAELIRSMVYSPWAALLAGGKRKRRAKG